MADGSRFVSRLAGSDPGPTLLIVGGVHGNEPAGLTAAREVAAELGGGFRGDYVALAGNLRALAVGSRYLARDLNRQWSPQKIAALDAGKVPEDPEGMEQRELRAAIDEVVAAARGPVFFLDLHTTSAGGVPFGLSVDQPKQRAFAAHFPLPVILGLEDQVEGVLSQYLRARGATTLSVEGGQHTDPVSVGYLAAAIRIALDAAGLVRLPGLEAARGELALARGELPPLIEILFRHAITPEEGFQMEPGFANIHPARAGQLLARDKSGEIRAPEDGVVLLPLYQPQGDDGFFFGRARA
jgi:succinylglutamate desuccinylase